MTYTHPELDKFKAVYTPKALAAVLSLAMGEKLHREQIKTLEKFAKESVGLPLPTNLELNPQYAFMTDDDHKKTSVEWETERTLAQEKEALITNFTSTSAYNVVNSRPGAKTNGAVRNGVVEKALNEKYLEGLTKLLPMLAGEDDYFRSEAREWGKESISGALVLRNFLRHVEKKKTEAEHDRQVVTMLTDEEMLKMAGLTGTDYDYHGNNRPRRQEIDELIDLLRDSETTGIRQNVSEITFRRALAKLDKEKPDKWETGTKIAIGATAIFSAAAIACNALVDPKVEAPLPDNTTPVVRPNEEAKELKDDGKNWVDEAVNNAVDKAIKDGAPKEEGQKLPEPNAASAARPLPDYSIPDRELWNVRGDWKQRQERQEQEDKIKYGRPARF